MQTAKIEDILRNKGFEPGVKHIFEIHNEQIRALNKQNVQLASDLAHLVDTLQNVVNGALGMKEQMEKRLKAAGLGGPQDDMDPNTRALGDDNG